MNENGLKLMSERFSEKESNQERVWEKERKKEK